LTYECENFSLIPALLARTGVGLVARFDGMLSGFSLETSGVACGLGWGLREDGGAMNKERPEAREPQARESHRVRLPGFLIEDEVGLGDVVKRATSAVGITPCSGCEQRAERLNRWVRFHR
jgi:hypothetical protein